MPARLGKVGDPAVRNSLLDAAQELMVDEGYAGVTTRRVAAKAGVNSSLVFYYFDSMDGLFVSLFQRGAERSFERLQEALSSAQPLWGFWELIHEPSGAALTMEFTALANHRKAIRTEIAEYSRRFRRAQLDVLSSVLADYDLDADRWPPESVILILSGISRYLLIEQEFDLDLGHAETEAIVERFITSLEGPRHAAIDAAGSHAITGEPTAAPPP